MVEAAVGLELNIESRIALIIPLCSFQIHYEVSKSFATINYKPLCY